MIDCKSFINPKYIIFFQRNFFINLIIASAKGACFSVMLLVMLSCVSQSLMAFDVIAPSASV